MGNDRKPEIVKPVNENKREGKTNTVKSKSHLSNKPIKMPVKGTVAHKAKLSKKEQERLSFARQREAQRLQEELLERSKREQEKENKRQERDLEKRLKIEEQTKQSLIDQAMHTLKDSKPKQLPDKSVNASSKDSRKGSFQSDDSNPWGSLSKNDHSSEPDLSGDRHLLHNDLWNCVYEEKISRKENFKSTSMLSEPVNTRNIRNDRSDKKRLDKENKSQNVQGQKGSRVNKASVSWKKLPREDFFSAKPKDMRVFQEAPVPEVNVWEERLARNETIKEMIPHNPDHEEIMIKQAILLSQQQAIEDERRRRRLEKEAELKLAYLSSILPKDEDNGEVNELTSWKSSEKKGQTASVEEQFYVGKSAILQLVQEKNDFSYNSAKPKTCQSKHREGIWDNPVALNDERSHPLLDSAKKFKSVSQDNWRLDNASSNMDSHLEEGVTCEKIHSSEETYHLQTISNSDVDGDFESNHSYRNFSEKLFVDKQNNGMKAHGSIVSNEGTMKGEHKISEKENLSNFVERKHYAKGNIGDGWNNEDESKRYARKSDGWDNKDDSENYAKENIEDVWHNEDEGKKHAKDYIGDGWHKEDEAKKYAKENIEDCWHNEEEGKTYSKENIEDGWHNQDEGKKYAKESINDSWNYEDECISAVKSNKESEDYKNGLGSPSINSLCNNAVEDNVLNSNYFKDVPKSCVSDISGTIGFNSEIREKLLVIDEVPNLETFIGERNASNDSKINQATLGIVSVDSASENVSGYSIKSSNGFLHEFETLKMCNNIPSVGPPEIPETQLSLEQNIINNQSQFVSNPINPCPQVFEQPPGSFLPVYPNAGLPLMNTVDMATNGMPLNPGLYPPVMWPQMMMMSPNPFFLQQLQMLQVYYASMGIPPPNPLLPMTAVPRNNGLGMFGCPQSYMPTVAENFSLNNANSPAQVTAPTAIPHVRTTMHDAVNLKPSFFSPPTENINISNVSQKYASELSNACSISNDNVSVDDCANISEKMSANIDAPVGFIGAPTMSQIGRQPPSVTPNFQNENSASQFSESPDVNIGDNSCMKPPEERRRRLHQLFYGETDCSAAANENIPYIRPPRQVLPENKSKSIVLEPIRQPKQKSHVFHSMVPEDSQSGKNNSTTISALGVQQNVKAQYLPNHYARKGYEQAQMMQENSRAKTGDDVKSDLLAFSNTELKSSLIPNVQKMKTSRVADNNCHGLLTGNNGAMDGNTQLDFEAWGNGESKDLASTTEPPCNMWSDSKDHGNQPVKSATTFCRGSDIWDDDKNENDNGNSIPARNVNSNAGLNKKYLESHYQEVESVYAPNTRRLGNGMLERSLNPSHANFMDKHQDHVTVERSLQQRQEKPQSGFQKIFKKSNRKPNF